MPTIQDFLNAGIPLKLEKCNEAEQRFSFGKVTPEQQEQIINMLKGDSPIVFPQPVHAPDFIVATPKPKTNPKDALVEAVFESKKGSGKEKSIALMVLDMLVYIEDLEKRVSALEVKPK